MGEVTTKPIKTPTTSIGQQLSEEFGLPSNFVDDLFLQTDDWSFVIKSHALIESLCTQLLLEHLKQPLLDKFVAKMDLTRKRQMLKALQPDLFSGPENTALNQLGALRNRVVHNVRNTQFSFAVEYADPDALKKLLGEFSPVWPPAKFVTVLLSTPRAAIWAAVVALSAKLHTALTGNRIKPDYLSALLEKLVKGEDVKVEGGPVGG
jgi:hypothetical protein